jgi:hypothetical protein
MTINPSASLFTFPRFQAFSSSGQPLAGGQLYSYAAGTLTPQATYTDSSLSTPNSNPIILDAFGSASVWLSPSVYKFNLLDVNGVQQANFPIDNIQYTLGQINSSTTTSQGQGYVGYNSSLSYPSTSLPGALASTSTGLGSSLVGYKSPGTNSISETVAKKLNQYISVIDFGADPTGIADSTAAFNNAIAYAVSLGAGSFGSNNSSGSGCTICSGYSGAIFYIAGTIIQPSGVIIDMGNSRLVGNNYTNNCIQSGYVYNGNVISNDISSCSFTASTTINSNIVTVTSTPTGSPLVAGALLYGAGLPYQCFFNAFGSGGTTGTGGTGTYQLNVNATSTNTNTACTAGMQSLVVGLQIKNCFFSSFNKAISITGCVDLCSFENCVYYNCIYSIWAYNCFYVTYKNHITRSSGGTTWLTTYANAPYHFDSWVNQCEMDSMFVVGRNLGFEFYNYVDGTQIRTCSVESCTNGVFFGGEVDLLDIHNCYFENISGTVLNLSAGYPHGNVTIDNNWFNATPGTIINAVQMGSGSTFGPGNHFTATATGNIYLGSDQIYNYMSITVPDNVGSDSQYGILTASVATNVLTVTAIPTGNTPVAAGSTINGVGIPVNTYILPFSTTGTTGTGGTGNYILSTTPGTVASANIGIAPAPLTNNLTGPQFNFGTGNNKLNIHGRNIINSNSTGLAEVTANGAILTANPIPYNFYGTSGYTPGAIPYCTQYTYVSGTLSTITITTKIVYDPYVMGRFALKIVTNQNSWQVVGHFSGPNVTMDVANGFSVALSSANGYVVLTVSGFASGTTVVSAAEGIIRLT